jgi:hypothetical protein
MLVELDTCQSIDLMVMAVDEDVFLRERRCKDGI